MKIERRGVITRTDNGIVAVPGDVKMSVSEIADLLGIYYQTAKRYIRAIEKTDIARGDDSMGGTVEGKNIYPDYYGLDVIIALAFRIQSRNAEVFRKWIQDRIYLAQYSHDNIVSKSNYFSLN